MTSLIGRLSSDAYACSMKNQAIYRRKNCPAFLFQLFPQLNAFVRRHTTDLGQGRYSKYLYCIEFLNAYVM